MKRILLYIAVLAIALTACHTTEENYKAAYDKAKQRTRDHVGGDIYDMEQAERMRPTEVIGGDSVRLLRSYFNVVDDKYENTKKFAVVVAEFDQLINARSYRDRLTGVEDEDNPSILYKEKELVFSKIRLMGRDGKGVKVRR